MTDASPVEPYAAQLERIEATQAFITATLQRHGLMLERITALMLRQPLPEAIERIAGKPLRDPG